MDSSSTNHGGPLGAQTQYQDGYDKSLLHPMTRSQGRQAVGLDSWQYAGEDQWTAYEFSWLNARGKPEVAELSFNVPVTSPNIIESKSMKLYLNGFSQTRFANTQEMLGTLERDLSGGFGCKITANLRGVNAVENTGVLAGQCLDDIDIDIEVYDYSPELLLSVDLAGKGEHRLYSHGFRSLCPVTGQPDWASIAIEYRGVTIEPAGLLRYLVSYRNHQAFHETTIERIFTDIWQRCSPQRLSVYGRFLRRGGIDINPYRSSEEGEVPHIRVARQ